jgi:hypothetical protein
MSSYELHDLTSAGQAAADHGQLRASRPDRGRGSGHPTTSSYELLSGPDRDRIAVNHMLRPLGQTLVMPQATVGIHSAGPRARADSQDLMDHAQDARERLPNG